MLNLPNYAHALRCVGQALQQRQIEAFEVKSHFRDFRLLVGDSNPPYTGLIEVQLSAQEIEVLEREGQGRRGQSNLNLSFDSVPEMLRAIGEYIDHRHGRLRRIDTCPSDMTHSVVRIEYQTRTGDLQTEDLTMSFLHDTSVRMYKHRARLPRASGVF